MPALRETIPLQKLKILKKSIGGTVGVLLVCGIISVFICLFLFAEPRDTPKTLLDIRTFLLVIWFSFVALLLISTPVYQYFYFKRYFYDMDGKNIVIRKGVIAQKEITLPFSRITDVYVDQDILDVPFGLYDVHISTPTQESGLFAHIDGVNKHGSVQLRQMLLDNINKEDG